MTSLVGSLQNSVLGLTFEIRKNDRLPYFEVHLRGIKVFSAESDALAMYGIRVYHDLDVIGHVLTEEGAVPEFLYLRSLRNASNFEKLKRAAELLSGKPVDSLHDEANKYCFRNTDGTIRTVEFGLLNGMAGLKGHQDNSLL